MSIGAIDHAQVDQLLLDMGRGLEPGVLVEIYGTEKWNQALSLAGAGNQARGIPDDILMDALAYKSTLIQTVAHALCNRVWRAAQEDNPVEKFAAWAVSELSGRGVVLDSPEAEDAWLELGQTYSQHARAPNYGGLGWTRVDAADHLLAALEPHVGLATKLRKWACSGQCALPNTLLAFRRGQIRINAAKARGQAVG